MARKRKAEPQSPPDTGAKRTLAGRAAITVAAVAVVASVLGNVDKIALLLPKFGQTAGQAAVSAAMSIGPIRNWVAQRALDRTYDGLACLVSSEPMKAAPGGWKSGFLATYNLCEGPVDIDLGNRHSAAVFVSDDWTQVFVGDINGHDFPGLQADVHNHFVVASTLETDFPNSVVYVIRSGAIRDIARVEGWTDDGDGDEMGMLSFDVKGDCLAVQSAGSGTFDLCDDGTDPGDPNPLGNDKRLGFALDSKDQPGLTINEDPAGYVHACSGECTLYVDILSRIVPPVGCIPSENLQVWTAFPHMYRIAPPTDFVLPADEQVASFFCGDKGSISLAYTGPYFNVSANE